MIDLININNLYKTANIPLEIYIVDDKPLREIRRRARFLKQTLESSLDSDVDEFFKSIDSIFNELYFLPVEISYNARLIEKIELISLLSEKLGKKLDQNEVIEISGIVSFFTRLQNTRSSTPFETELYRLIDESAPNLNDGYSLAIQDKTLVVTKRKRHQNILQSVLEDLGVSKFVDIRVPNQLKMESSNYNQTIILGPLDFYGNVSSILGNLVTNRLLNLSHFKPRELMFGLFQYANIPYMREVKYTSFTNYAHDTAPMVESDEIQQIGGLTQELDLLSLLESVDGISKEDEIVECRMMRFVDGRYVLFPEDDIQDGSEKIDVLVETENINERVISISVEDLEEDSIMLLRDGETSKSAIIPEANKVLRTSAALHRSNQSKWKIKLLEKLERLGRERVNRDLQDYGIESPYANEWSKVNFIRPQSDKDFDSLLRYLGFGEVDRRQIFESSIRIRGAHSTAGRNITSGLKKAFSDVKLSEIYESGSLIKSLEGDDKARVIAVVCEGFDEKLYRARLSLTRKILGSEDISK
jgi:hypothetical protein